MKMLITLERHAYGPKATEGYLMVGDFRLATIERPWIAHGSPGGMPFRSCIPDGEYLLQPFTRSRGSKAYRILGREYGVYPNELDLPEEGGRYAILIHIGNWVTDIVGCIAPGMRHAIMRNRKTDRQERAVSSSGEAMRIITGQLGDEEHNLSIRSKCGTGEAR